MQQELINSLNWRYAVKRFDATKRIDTATWEALEQSLVLTPSSYGLQPWKFFVITDEATKAKLPEMSWNQQQPKDCSHMVVLAAKRTMDAAYVDRYIASVETGRGLPDGAMDGYRNILHATVAGMDAHLDWNSRQVYIALGQLMVAAAVLGVDACPMEGIVPDHYDALLGIADSEYTTVVGCALGYRHPEDKQAEAAKIRFPASELVVHV